MRIKPGTALRLWTEDAFNYALKSVEHLASTKVSLAEVNPQTGPFYVEVGSPARRISKASAQFFLDWVRERLEELSPPQRRSIELHYFEGLTLEQIAARLGLHASVIAAARHNLSARETQLAEHLAKIDHDMRALEHDRRIAARERESVEAAEARIRERERALLDKILAQVVGGRGHMAVLHGDAGIGKQ
mgnify:CR=1 FL=1